MGFITSQKGENMLNKKALTSIAAALSISISICSCSEFSSSKINPVRSELQNNLLDQIKISRYGKNYQPILDYVGRNWIPAHSDPDINNLDIVNISQNLTLLGYGVNDLARLKKKDVNIIKSMQNSSLGISTLKDEFAISKVVVLAELVRVESDKRLNDGYQSTAVFRKKDMLKGNDQGQYILVRQVSDFVEGGMAMTSDFSPSAVGGQYLLFLSRSAYEINSGKRAPSYFISTLLPYEIRDGKLSPTGLGQQSGLKVSDLK